MRTLVISLALVSAIAVPTSLAAQTTEQTFYVSVLDKDNQPVSGLSVADFIVKEDGVQREVLRAGRTADPIDLAIVVDDSQAVQPYLNDVRTALTSFVTKMADEQSASVALIAMADRPTGLQDYTSSSVALRTAVTRIFPQPAAGTVFQDAINDTVKGLKARTNPRKAILVISTEGTDFSNVPYQRTLDVLTASGAALHVLLLTNRDGAVYRDELSRDRAYIVDHGTHATGGRRQELLSSMGLSGALDQVAADLASQYKVVFSRPGSLLPPKAVEIRVTRPNVSTRGTLVKPTQAPDATK